MADDSTFDLVLWGATGFTGRLVAEHLADRYDPGELHWTIAGRNREKLEGLRSELPSGYETLSILTGDARDRESLDEIAGRAKTVCSTVGPYALYGTDLVAACVEAGTNYCDLTGEIPWIRRMIDRFHEAAVESGSRIVHACGFDSVPSDLGALMIQQRARERFGSPCSRVKAFVSAGGGGFSGGTVASLLNVIEEASDSPEVRRILEDPYSLAPAGEREGPDGPSQRWPRYEDDLNSWTAPFLMAPINEKIVRRSNALLQYPYGRDFRYRESLPTGSGWAGALRAGGLAVGMATIIPTLSFQSIRSLLQSTLLPEPGEGPSRSEREAGSFEMQLIGKGSSPDEEPFEVRGTVSGDRDPGYGSTARMLGESAVCLARGNVDTHGNGGVLTPASGIGTPLMDRLNRAGLSFEITEDKRLY